MVTIITFLDLVADLDVDFVDQTRHRRYRVIGVRERGARARLLFDVLGLVQFELVELVVEEDAETVGLGVFEVGELDSMTIDFALINTLLLVQERELDLVDLVTQLELERSVLGLRERDVHLEI